MPAAWVIRRARHLWNQLVAHYVSIFGLKQNMGRRKKHFQDRLAPANLQSHLVERRSAPAQAADVATAVHDSQRPPIWHTAGGERPLRQASLLQMQQQLGNSWVQRLLQTNGRATGVQLKKTAKKTVTPEDMAEEFRQYGLQQDGLKDYCEKASADQIITLINGTIDGFPDEELKKQIGAGLKNRKDFLIGMTPYLGSFEDVVMHFSNIRRVNVPGIVHLHEDAATRMEMVAGRLAEMRLPMPATTVALGLRDRYRPHSRNSKGLMAHPMGYAIDYRATTNPMITDPRLVALLSLQTGGPINFEFKDEKGRAMGWNERRNLIKQLGSELAGGTLSEDTRRKAKHFMQQFAGEYERVSEASRNFTESMSEDMQKAQALVKTEAKLETELASLRKRKRKGWEEKASELQQELDAVREQLGPIKQNLEKLFEPWLENIKEAMKKTETEVAGLVVNLAGADGSVNSFTGRELLDMSEKEINDLVKQVNRQRRAKRKKDSTVPVPPDLQKEFMGKWKWYNHYLKALAKALKEDPDFVFKGQSSVKNPAVMQLLEKGFFTPDNDAELLAMAPDERPDPAKLNANKHGFNLRFMQVMALYGFDQGISWSPTSLDAMHLELIEGVDSIHNAKAKG